jgi:hypothetical protein
MLELIVNHIIGLAMKTKLIIPLVILLCAISVVAYYLFFYENQTETISCETKLYYKFYIPKPEVVANYNIIINLKGDSDKDDGRGKFSITANFYDGKNTYYIRRDIIASYEVDDNGLYFFKTLYINKYARDTIPENIEKRLVPDAFAKINSLSGYTIRPVGKQGYFIYETDIPVFYCNRI